MNPEQWRIARDLFEAAVELPRSEWDGLLQRSCDDQYLRAEVRAMLEADAPAGEAGGLLDRAPDLVGDYTRQAAEQRVGQRFGAWRPLHVLAEGGMGTVYLAERIDGGFVQRAALKVVRSGYGQADMLARLAAERQILAGLEHPNIARLLDGGAGENGEPFLAMELVEGVDLREYCDAQSLDIPSRLRLFLTVCDAVAYAHARLVVHRDLKPANVLVSTVGDVKLLDFGVAKVVDPQVSGTATIAQRRLFTPEYAAPELIAGEITTTAVDVYSLGVILFELLTGLRPYAVDGLSAAGIERVVLNSAPTRPSGCVTGASGSRRGHTKHCEALASRRATTPAQLRRMLRGDLDAIVLKALRKEPTERHRSVQLLADDVSAFLQRRPVSARRGSLRYTVSRFVQRHAVAVGFAALACVALLVGTGASLWQAQAARTEAATSRAALAFMQDLFSLADPETAHGRDVSARELLDSGSHRIRITLHDQPAARGVLLAAMGQAYLGLGLYDQALPLFDEALPMATAGNDTVAMQRVVLARGAALHGLGRFQRVLDELGPLRESAPLHSDADRLWAAGLDHQLGLAAQSLGKREAAEHYHDAALRTREAMLGLTDRGTQEVMVALVSLYVLNGRYPDAMRLAQRGLAALDAQPKPDELLRADALSALALVQHNSGDLAEAERLRAEVLAIYRRIYGDTHPNTITALNNLASVLYTQRRYREVVPMFDEVLAARRRQFGADHPKIATAASNAAFAHLMTSNVQQALQLGEEATAIRTANYGRVHTGTVQSIEAMAAALLALGRLDEAERLFEEAVLIHAELRGPDNTQSISARNNLARVQLARAGTPADCRHSERSVALAKSDSLAGNVPFLYAFALHLACQSRRGDASVNLRLRETVASYRAHVAADDPSLAILDGLLDGLHVHAQ